MLYITLMDLITNNDWSKKSEEEYSVSLFDHFMVVPVVYHNLDQEEEFERLGIDEEVDTQDGYMTINLHEVGAFYPIPTDEGVEDIHDTMVYIQGVGFRVKLPTPVFQYFISQWLDKNDKQTP